MNISEIAQSILRGSYSAPESGTYTPTLVVGLGGTGMKVVRNLKKLLLRHEESRVQLLAIDSDIGENTSNPSLPRLSESEVVILDQSVAVGSLERAKAGHESDKHILEYVPDRVGSRTGLHQEIRNKIASQKGAGQLRRAGRLLLCSNVTGGANLKRKLGEIHRSMQGLQAIVAQRTKGLTVSPGAKIYVISSVAGGTGAGALLDFLALLRTEFNGPQDIITVFAALPGVLLDLNLRNPVKEGPVTRGNAIGLLRELQALQRGNAGSHTFRFDERLSIRVPSLLANDVYLIDHQNLRRTPADSFLDICQAIGYFVYSLVGSGVGAAQQSGMVNGVINFAQAVGDIDRMFNSLGIGAIEYPAEELCEYAARCSLHSWLEDWLGNAGTNKAAAESAETLRSRLHLLSPQALQGRIQPPLAEVKEATFLASANERNLVLAASDDEFVGKGRVRINNIDSDLVAHETSLESNCNNLVTEVTQGIGTWALGILGDSSAQTTKCLGTLQTQLAEIDAQLLKEREKREADIKSQLAAFQLKEKKIHFWDYGLDKELRREYIQMVNAYLQTKLTQKADIYVQRAVAAIASHVNSLAAAAQNLAAAADAWKIENTSRVHQIVQRGKRAGFVQSALPRDDFDKWVLKNGISVSDSLNVGSFDWNHVLDQALASVMAGYGTKINALHLVSDSRRDASLLARVRTVNDTSAPIINLISSAPDVREMQPQKFVAATIDDGTDPYLTNFKAVSAADPVGIPTTNHNTLICAETCHGFGVAHWQGYIEAENAYRADPWYFHILPDFEDLPPLRAVSEIRSVNLRTLGVGMMFDLIVIRGSNYYCNLVFSTTEDVFYYIIYKNKEDFTTPVAELAATGLICEAPASQLRPKSSNLLADSLEKTLEKLTEPAQAALHRDIQSVLEDFITQKGRRAMSELLNGFVAGDLDKLISKATGTRRTVIEEIAQTLKAYAVELG